jgi:hypothetical protein
MELSYPARPLRRRLGGAPEVGQSSPPKYLLQSPPSLYRMIMHRLVWLTAPPQRIGQRLAP